MPARVVHCPRGQHEVAMAHPKSDGAFQELFSVGLERLRDQMCRAHREALAQHVREKVLLQEQVARLRAQLQQVLGNSQNQEGLEHSAEQVLPPLPPEEPPASCKALFFVPDGQKEKEVHFSEEPDCMDGPLARPVVMELGVEMAPHSHRRVTSPGCKAIEDLRYISEKSDASNASPSVKQRGGELSKIPLHGAKSSDPARRPSVATTNSSVESTEIIRQRLQARLGQLSSKSMVTGHDIHQAVNALGLEKYTLKDMNYLIHRLARLINLKFTSSEKDAAPTIRPTLTRQLTKGKSSKDLDNIRAKGQDLAWMANKAEWTWPDMDRDSRGSLLLTSGGSNTSNEDYDEDHSDKALPMKALMKAFTCDEIHLRKLLGSSLSEQLRAIKEVLLTGDTNRLVAELTCVRIDDLAGKQPEMERSLIMEPLVGAMIILNGLLIGVQTDRRVENWEGWFWIETFFAVFFLFEICLRLRISGCEEFFRGVDRNWNIFDLLLVAMGVVDCITSIATLAQEELYSTTLLRFARMARLSRLVRVFRLKFMQELQLMIKGVLSGVRTLFWAFVLLFFVLYVLSVFATTTVGRGGRGGVEVHFASVPESMFTAFRCFAGECFAANGQPIPAVLMEDYGVFFVFIYLASYMIVSLGIFNVIMAIYVEITMTAAKQTEETNKVRHERESIRVAHVTKQLLKMFCAAEQLFTSVSAADRTSIDISDVIETAEDINVDDDILISKELFLLVIQERQVQNLMDDLDIPPDRANLFDTIDADGSGSLHVTELVQGLLKVRGEVKKSDIVACFLGMRAVQDMLRQMDEAVQKNHTSLMDQLGLEYKAPQRTTLLGTRSVKHQHSY